MGYPIKKRVCYSCYWCYAPDGGTPECHARGKRFDEAGYCVKYKRIEAEKEPDTQELWEEYQEEWN